MGEESSRNKFVMIPPLKNNNFQEFEYVVERKLPNPICFGSRVRRNTNPIGEGLSPFQRLKAPELFTTTGPGRYATEKYNTAFEKITNKVRSKKGAGPLASGDPRFKEKIFMRTPSPTRYNTVAAWLAKRETKAPFGSHSKRMAVKGNNQPGPGTYNTALKKCRRTRFMYNFGHPTMIPTTEIICVSRPTDTCLKCNQICGGDYWHKEHTTYLCHLCWEEERRSRELFSEPELNTFKKIRNCSFAHNHEGTAAATRLLPPSKINKKLRLENYLDLYIHC